MLPAIPPSTLDDSCFTLNAPDVAFPGMPKVWRMPNDASGIAALIQQVRRLDGPHVVSEATGGYTRRLTGDLAAETVPPSRVNPRQVRNLTRATGRLATCSRRHRQMVYGAA